jgi:hypothetical protein
VRESTTSEVTTALHKVVASLRIAQEVMERHRGLFVREQAVEAGGAADIADKWIRGIIKDYS